MLVGIAYAQEPTYTPMKGSYRFKGIRVDSLFLIPAFNDTTAANGTNLDQIAGAMIRCGNDFYMRNAATTAWLQNVNVGDGVSPVFNYISGIGDTNYVPKFSAAKTITNSQIFDNGDHVGIGTSTPGDKLEVNGSVKANKFYTSLTYLTDSSVGGGASYFKIKTTVANRPIYISPDAKDVMVVNNYPSNKYIGVGISDNGDPLTVINDSSVLLGLVSDRKGFLLPKLTDTQISNIDNPANGIMVYAADTNRIKYYDGNDWQAISVEPGYDANIDMSSSDVFINKPGVYNITAYDSSYTLSLPDPSIMGGKIIVIINFSGTVGVNPYFGISNGSTINEILEKSINIFSSDGTTWWNLFQN